MYNRGRSRERTERTTVTERNSLLSPTIVSKEFGVRTRSMSPMSRSTTTKRTSFCIGCISDAPKDHRHQTHNRISTCEDHTDVPNIQHDESTYNNIPPIFDNFPIIEKPLPLRITVTQTPPPSEPEKPINKRTNKRKMPSKPTETNKSPGTEKRRTKRHTFKHGRIMLGNYMHKIFARKMNELNYDTTISTESVRMLDDLSSTIIKVLTNEAGALIKKKSAKTIKMSSVEGAAKIVFRNSPNFLNECSRYASEAVVRANQSTVTDE